MHRPLQLAAPRAARRRVELLRRPIGVTISLPEEVPLNWSTLIRQTHRWTSIAFTLAVVVTTIALARENPVIWVSYVPLFPLAVLFLTGLYLFALPYATKWRRGRKAGGPVLE
jgi:hypothetical protein